MQVFLNDVREWGESDARINGILLVGSYAKGTQREDSDIDLVIISSQKERLIHNPDFMNRFGHVKNFSVEFWGACTSFRIYYDDMEVEFGIVEPSWLHQPLDAVIQYTERQLNRSNRRGESKAFASAHRERPVLGMPRNAGWQMGHREQGERQTPSIRDAGRR
jgi:predicted nucleotidyltransferase